MTPPTMPRKSCEYQGQNAVQSDKARAWEGEKLTAPAAMADAAYFSKPGRRIDFVSLPSLFHIIA
jgi:lipopolysaccharide export system protein LptA